MTLSKEEQGETDSNESTASMGSSSDKDRSDEEEQEEQHGVDRDDEEKGQGCGIKIMGVTFGMAQRGQQPKPHTRLPQNESVMDDDNDDAENNLTVNHTPSRVKIAVTNNDEQQYLEDKDAAEDTLPTTTTTATLIPNELPVSQVRGLLSFACLCGYLLLYFFQFRPELEESPSTTTTTTPTSPQDAPMLPVDFYPNMTTVSTDTNNAYDHAQWAFFQELNTTLQLNNHQRCHDYDDPPELQQMLSTCTCTNPWQATERPEPVRERWLEFHQHLIETTQQQQQQQVLNNNSSSSSSNHPPLLDLIMLGDSIMERRMGSEGLGHKHLPKIQQANQEYFDKRKYPATATLQALTLGSDGDTSYEMLWHLQNGLLSRSSSSTSSSSTGNLRPRAILLLLGMNDVWRVDCSKRNALAGILNTARYLYQQQQQQQPGTKMILHGLLPCTDGYKDGNYALGYKYEKIQWINHKLREFCDLHPDWYYVDNTDVFLTKPHGTAMNRTLSIEGVYPTIHGYHAWNQRLVPQITQILGR